MTSKNHLLSIGEATSDVSLSDRVQVFLPKWKLRDVEEKEIHSVTKQSNITIPSLVLLSQSVVVKNFETRPVRVGRVSIDIFKSIVERLPIDLDPKVGATHIDDEKYWKRVCVAKYGEVVSSQIEHHGLTWKRLFFERYCEQILLNEESIKNNDNLFQKVIYE